MPQRIAIAALVIGAVGLASITGSVSGATAIGLPFGNCSGNTFSWTGKGDGHSWSDAENWTPEAEAPPKSGDTATIQGSEAAEAEVEGGSEVCELTIEGSDAFLTNSNLTIEETSPGKAANRPKPPVNWKGPSLSAGRQRSAASWRWAAGS